jgi:hypothetical protein
MIVNGRWIIITVTALIIFLLSTTIAYAAEPDFIGFKNADIAFAVNNDSVEMVTENYYRVSHEGMTAEVMVDDLRGTPHYAYNMSMYGVRYIIESAYTVSYSYSQAYVFDRPTHLYTFERKPLKYAGSLKDHFLYIEIEVEPQVLLSIHIASDTPIDQNRWLSRLVETCSEGFDQNSLMEVDKPGIINSVAEPFRHEETNQYFEDTFVDSTEVTWGIFDPSTHYMLNDVENIESETGIQLDIILEYYDLGYLPRLEMMQMIADSGRVLELTYQTSKYGAFNADYLYEVLSGTHDEAIDELINRIVMLDEPVLFRPNNEMNGDWCSYNAMYTHKDTAVYRAFWRWLHDRFEEAGAENVIWVWNPNWGDFPSAQWNSYLNYFPGEDYVDVIGLTGYNTGTYYPDESWRSFDEIYLPMLWEYNRRFSGFPYMITEFGSSATGGDKGAWIASALDMVEKMNIKAAVWWNHVDYDTSRGAISRGYKFDNDRKMLSVFRQNFKGE